MGIKFTSDDWARVKEAHIKWWNKELERPLIQIRLHGKGQSRMYPC